MIFFILTNLLSLAITTVYSEDCVTCTEDLIPFSSIEKSMDSLKQSTTINCEDHLKKAAKDEYIHLFAKLPTKTAVVKGLKLKGTTDEISFLNKMLNNKPVKEWSKASECDTVICALTKVYDSEEAAHRVLNIAKRNGFIISASKDFNIEGKDAGQLFSLNELKTIDLAYKKLPPTFSKLKTLDRIKRMPDGYSSTRSPNAAAYASPGIRSPYYNSEGEITFLDGSFTNDLTWGPLVAVHELTHHKDFSKHSDHAGHSESAEYLKLSGWSKKETITKNEKNKVTKELTWEHAKDKNFVSSYAGTQPAEDLAESAAFYMFEPRKLLAIDPLKYEYLKKHLFDGKEYLNDPDILLSNDEIFKQCLKDSKEIFVGFYFGPIMESCLDKFGTSYPIVDPNLCSFNSHQLKQSANDRIYDLLDSTNESLKRCHENISLNKAACADEGNFQKTCAINKCKLDDFVSVKVKEFGYVNREKEFMETLVKKLGHSEFITHILSAGLAPLKKKTNHHSNLTYNSQFLKNAANSFNEIFSKENFKFDADLKPIDLIERHIMMNKETVIKISSFENFVLKAAGKSKEQNLILIKEWAAHSSIEESENFNKLAEALVNYNK